MSWLDVKTIVLISCTITVVVLAQDISLKGQYVCSLHPSNQLWMELVAYDENGVAVRMNAINTNKEDITSCVISGAGSTASPFFMSTKISMTDNTQTENSCGLKTSTLNGVTVYDWQFKAYTYIAGQPTIRKGFILNVQCNTGDLRDGRVETLIDFNVPSFTVTASNPADVTGINSVADNANIIYTAKIYPDGRNLPTALADAVGIYVYNCVSATSADMQENRELFIDGNGCRVAGATFSPSGNFQSVSTTGGYVGVEARFATAQVVNGKNNIYLSCQIGKCTQQNDPFCINRCAAYTNGQTSPSGTNTGLTYTTAFTVQDHQAQQLAPTRPNDLNVVTSANVGSKIRLVSYNSPAGIGASSDLADAKGFYIYNCRYATNEAMTSSTQFVDNNGCSIPNTKLTPSSNFALDDLLSSPSNNLYVITSGQITLQNVGNFRVWVQCDTGKCTVENHNYCKTRCGAVNNIAGGAVNLGYRGQTFTISVLDPVTVPAVNIIVQSSNGQVIANSGTVNVGDRVNLSLNVTPGGTGTGSGAFANAQGIFIYSCYATNSARPHEQTMFIDENGCPVQNSPYRTSSTCKDTTAVDGIPPYSVNCGSLTVPEEGNITQSCKVGICTTKSNPFCEDRCAAGEIQPNSNVQDSGVTSTQGFKSEIRNLKRTAIRSEELQNIIIAVTIVLSFLLLLVAIIATCVVVSKQRSRAKRLLDERSYNY